MQRRRQSAKIWFDDNIHNEIWFDGYYHDAIYRGSELLWRKIPWAGIELKVDTSLMLYHKPTKKYLTFIRNIYTYGTIYVNWGDGTSSKVVGSQQSPTCYLSNVLFHWYDEDGEYKITIDGNPESIGLYNEYFSYSGSGLAYALQLDDKNMNNYDFPIADYGSYLNAPTLEQSSRYNADTKEYIKSDIIFFNVDKYGLATPGIIKISGKLPSSVRRFDVCLNTTWSSFSITRDFTDSSKVSQSIYMYPCDRQTCIPQKSYELFDLGIFETAKKLSTLTLSGFGDYQFDWLVDEVDVAPNLTSIRLGNNPYLRTMDKPFYSKLDLERIKAENGGTLNGLGWFYGFIQNTRVVELIPSQFSMFEGELDHSNFTFFARGDVFYNDITIPLWEMFPAKTTTTNSAFAYTEKNPTKLAGDVAKNAPWYWNIPKTWY